LPRSKDLTNWNIGGSSALSALIVFACSRTNIHEFPVVRNQPLLMFLYFAALLLSTVGK
jgi:hypothetical protein